MDADHGQRVNNQAGVTSVDLDDVAAASATIKDLENHNHLQQVVQAKAVIYAIPKSIRQKVISLHRLH